MGGPVGQWSDAQSWPQLKKSYCRDQVPSQPTFTLQSTERCHFARWLSPDVSALVMQLLKWHPWSRLPAHEALEKLARHAKEGLSRPQSKGSLQTQLEPSAWGQAPLREQSILSPTSEQRRQDAVPEESAAEAPSGGSSSAPAKRMARGCQCTLQCKERACARARKAR